MTGRLPHSAASRRAPAAPVAGLRLTAGTPRAPTPACPGARHASALHDRSGRARGHQCPAGQSRRLLEPSRPAVPDGLRRYGRAALDPVNDTRRPSHRRALADRLACRPEAQGALCPGEPGGLRALCRPSCRHRRGPLSPDHETDAKRDERRQARLPGQPGRSS